MEAAAIPKVKFGVVGEVALLESIRPRIEVSKQSKPFKTTKPENAVGGTCHEVRQIKILGRR